MTNFEGIRGIPGRLTVTNHLNYDGSLNEMIKLAESGMQIVITFEGQRYVLTKDASNNWYLDNADPSGADLTGNQIPQLFARMDQAAGQKRVWRYLSSLSAYVGQSLGGYDMAAIDSESNSFVGIVFDLGTHVINGRNFPASAKSVSDGERVYRGARNANFSFALADLRARFDYEQVLYGIGVDGSDGLAGELEDLEARAEGAGIDVGELWEDFSVIEDDLSVYDRLEESEQAEKKYNTLLSVHFGYNALRAAMQEVEAEIESAEDLKVANISGFFDGSVEATWLSTGNPVTFADLVTLVNAGSAEEVEIGDKVYTCKQIGQMVIEDTTLQLAYGEAVVNAIQQGNYIELPDAPELVACIQAALGGAAEDDGTLDAALLRFSVGSRGTNYTVYAEERVIGSKGEEETDRTRWEVVRDVDRPRMHVRRSERGEFTVRVGADPRGYAATALVADHEAYEELAALENARITVDFMRSRGVREDIIQGLEAADGSRFIYQFTNDEGEDVVLNVRNGLDESEWVDAGIGTQEAFNFWSIRGRASKVNDDGTVDGDDLVTAEDIQKTDENIFDQVAQTTNASEARMKEIYQEYLQAEKYIVIDIGYIAEWLIGVLEGSVDYQTGLAPHIQSDWRPALDTMVMNLRRVDSLGAVTDPLTKEELKMTFKSLTVLMVIENPHEVLGLSEKLPSVGNIGGSEKKFVAAIFDKELVEKFEAEQKGRKKGSGKSEGSTDMTELTDFSDCEDDDAIRELAEENAGEVRGEGPDKAIDKLEKKAQIYRAAAEASEDDEQKYVMYAQALQFHMHAMEKADALFGEDESFEPDKVADTRQVYDAMCDAWDEAQELYDEIEGLDVSPSTRSGEINRMIQQYEETRIANDKKYSGGSEGFSRVRLAGAAERAQRAVEDLDRDERKIQLNAAYVMLDSMLDDIGGNVEDLEEFPDVVTALQDAATQIEHLATSAAQNTSSFEGVTGELVLQSFDALIRACDLLEEVGDESREKALEIRALGLSAFFSLFDAYVDGTRKYPGAASLERRTEAYNYYRLGLLIEEQSKSAWYNDEFLPYLREVGGGVRDIGEAERTIKKIRGGKVTGLINKLKKPYRDLGGRVEGGRFLPPSDSYKDPLVDEDDEDDGAATARSSRRGAAYVHGGGGDDETHVAGADELDGEDSDGDKGAGAGEWVRQVDAGGLVYWTRGEEMVIGEEHPDHATDDEAAGGTVIELSEDESGIDEIDPDLAPPTRSGRSGDM